MGTANSLLNTMEIHVNGTMHGATDLHRMVPRPNIQDDSVVKNAFKGHPTGWSLYTLVVVKQSKNSYTSEGIKSLWDVLLNNEKKKRRTYATK